MEAEGEGSALSTGSPTSGPTAAALLPAASPKPCPLTPSTSTPNRPPSPGGTTTRAGEGPAGGGTVMKLKLHRADQGKASLGDSVDYEVIGEQDEQSLRQVQADELKELRRKHETQLKLERCKPPVVPESVGLENPIGAHNCFLNVVLQSLWHLTAFRRLLLQDTHPHRCQSKGCIACSMRGLFTQYKFGTYAHLPPQEVREVVSCVFMEQQRFQVDQMDDAAELLDAMLLQLHADQAEAGDQAAHSCQPPCISHTAFGAEIIERSTQCKQCHQVGAHVETYIQLLHYLPSSLLLEEGDVHARMRVHLESEVRTCSECAEASPPAHSELPIQKHLCTVPPIVAFVLAWGNDRSTREQLTSITTNMLQTLNLDQVYRMAADVRGPHPYSLRGLICFYGHHYVAYFWNRVLDEWVYLDDSYVRPLGSWANVQQTIIDGRHMPLVLFYVRSP
uniref:USP domain-containing protein n=1 Tax=Eutreptiella gymnastica TaxID=73025 RepID=A0A7S1NCR5_9EUGL